MTEESTSGRKTEEERKEALAILVISRLNLGRRIESQTDYQVVLVSGQPVNHILHLLLTIITVGLWSIIWLTLVGTGGERREIARVDGWGNTSVTEI